MISIILGSLFLVIGVVLAWNLLREWMTPGKRRKVDPNFFKSVEIAVIEEPASNAWAASASFQKRTDDSLDFDFGPELDEDIQPIGLSSPKPINSLESDQIKKSIPPKGIGFADPDEEEEGPTQETLGF